MLQVDLRELARGPVETSGELPADDPLFGGLSVPLGAPVVVTGRLQAAGEGQFFWQGALRTRVQGECRRCLVPVAAPVAADIGALFSEDPDAADDPDTYPLPPRAAVIDVTPAVREELVLAVPAFLECREDCRGLCPRCGQNLNAGPCGCAPVADPRWRALSALKGKLREPDEE
jgi:DUF177 domain-containing protein